MSRRRVHPAPGCQSTAATALLWGWDDLGSIAAGKAASLLVLDADPTADPAPLARVVHVIVDGKLL